MDVNTSLTYWYNLFTHTGLFGIGGGFILSLGIVLLSALIISPHKPSNIKTLIFPLMVGYKIIGLNIPIVFLGLAGIVFIMETLSIQVVQSGISAVVERIQEYRGIKDEREESLLNKAKRKIALKNATKNLEEKGFTIKRMRIKEYAEPTSRTEKMKYNIFKSKMNKSSKEYGKRQKRYKYEIDKGLFKDNE